MHSSRTRTARLLPVSPSLHCAGGCLPWGSAPEGVCSWVGMLLGVCSLGDLLLGGSASGSVSQHAMGRPPISTEFLTHATENITLPQLRYGRYQDFINHIRFKRCSNFPNSPVTFPAPHLSLFPLADLSGGKETHAPSQSDLFSFPYSFR